MQDKITIKAPAKINLFLKVLKKRKDGCHNIKSGITFINLYDEIEIWKSNKTSIEYYGDFKPTKGFYDNCIIKKILKSYFSKKKLNIKIIIKKNIPVQGGLGSASTNAAAFLKGLKKLKIIDIESDYSFESLGADLQCFLYGQNCLVYSFGNKIIPFNHPKYYFLLIKPKVNFSTKEMYTNLNREQYKNIEDQKNESTSSNLVSSGNDFEKIALSKSEEKREILCFLKKTERSIISSISGTGSCCFSSYEKKELALEAQDKFSKKFPGLWTFIAENNTINN